MGDPPAGFALADLRHRENVTADFRRAGFSILMTTYTSRFPEHFVCGFGLQEARLALAYAAGLADRTDESSRD